MPIEKDPAEKPVPAQTKSDRESALEQELASEREARKRDMEQLAGAIKDPATVKALYDQVVGTKSETTDDDDSTLIDKKELKRLLGEQEKKIGGALSETTAHTARQLTSANKELLRGKLKNFDKHEKEIDDVLNTLSPLVASKPETIKQVHALVTSRHPEDFQSEASVSAKREMIEKLTAKGYSEEEIESALSDEPEEEEEEVVETKRVETRRVAAAPSGDASASRPQLRRKESITPLSREEKEACNVFGLTPEEFRKYGDRTWKPDIMGAKGRAKF